LASVQKSERQKKKKKKKEKRKKKKKKKKRKKKRTRGDPQPKVAYPSALYTSKYPTPKRTEYRFDCDKLDRHFFFISGSVHVVERPQEMEPKDKEGT
jgi:hypothetical protein